jgi:hypothetical protein
MKKVLIYLVITLSLVFGGGYFLAFTKSGNDFLLPFINSYLKKKIKVADIKLDSFRLTPKHIMTKANINSMADVDIDGDFDVIKKSFNLTYKIDAKKIETKEFKFNEKVYIKGVAVGNIKKAKIFGLGKVANSKVEFKLDLENKKPKNITAKIDKASLKKLLLLAGQKPYADGIVTLVANIPSLDKQSLKGSAILDIKKGYTNSKLIKREFKVELPLKTVFNLDLRVNLKKDIAKAKITLLSNLLNLKTKRSFYNVKSNSFESDYQIDIKDLAKLYLITKTKLRGKFKGYGDIKYKKDLVATLNTSSLGGKIETILIADRLKAYLTNVSTNAIFYRLNLPKYTDARINGELILNSVKNLTGKFNIKADGVNKRLLLKKLYNFDSDRDIKYNLKADGTIKNQKIYLKADIKNSFGDIKLKNMVYKIKNNSLTTLYTLYLDNLAKLNYITKQKLVGNLKVDGHIKQDDSIMIDGHSNKFGGDIDFKLLDNKLTATVKGASALKIQGTLSYPAMLEAKTFSDFNYDLKTSKGKAVITMKEAKLLPSNLTKIIASLGGTDLTAKHYNNTKLIANLSKNLIIFDFKAISKAVSVLIDKGKIYQPEGRLDSKVLVTDNKRTIPLKLTGTTSNPKIKLDSSFVKDELKKKARERLKQEKVKLKEKLKKRLENKIKDKLKNDIAKDLLKKLF